MWSYDLTTRSQATSLVASCMLESLLLVPVHTAPPSLVSSHFRVSIAMAVTGVIAIAICPVVSDSLAACPCTHGSSSLVSSHSKVSRTVVTGVTAVA